MNILEIERKILALADPEYADFVAKGAPSNYPVIGVRVPELQRLAEEIFQKNNYQEFLDKIKPKSREEIHLKSFVMTMKIKQDGINKDEFFAHIKEMDSWEMVDVFCSRLKSVKKNREDWLEVIDELLGGSEFLARTGIVLLLDYYIEPEWIQVVFERIVSVKQRDEYYVKMAVAWILQKSFVYFPDQTFVFMQKAGLSPWVLKKAASKIRDSYRIDAEWKEKVSIF